MSKFNLSSFLTNKVTLIGGQEIYGVHAPDRCAGDHCCIHNPSPHHMREWPQWFDGVTHLMYRRCEHGIVHLDPDDPQAWAYEVDHKITCDGCCEYDSAADEIEFEAYRAKLAEKYEELEAK